MNNKLLELLKLEAQEIKLSFEKASLEGEGTPQEVADRRERALVNTFLKKYFPFPYRITKGNIIDSYTRRSNSIDCIVLSPSHPYTIDPKNESASIIFADGVDAVIEVKPDLSNKNEIERVLTQIQSVKKLRRKRNGLLLQSNYNEQQIKCSYQIPTFVFAEKTYDDIRLLISHIIDFYVSQNVPLEEQFDFIIINNKTVLFNSREHSYSYLHPNIGICFAETAENTLATFLFWLNNVAKSEPQMGPSVMSFYLDYSLFSGNLKTFDDLNAKINAYFSVSHNQNEL